MTDSAIRPYRPTDHAAGRKLWVELIEEHRQLYEDPAYVGADAGGGFEEYLTRLDLSGIWVAEARDAGVVGLVGLLVDGRGGRVEPVVVTRRWRGRGIGRALLEQVAGEARRRGLARLTVTPAARNVEALRCLHAAGYDVLAAVQLTVDLRGGKATRSDATRQAVTDIHGIEYRL